MPLMLGAMAATATLFHFAKAQERDRFVAVERLLERCTVVVQGFDPEKAQKALTSPYVMQQQAKRRYSICKSLFQTNDLLRHDFDQIESEMRDWHTDGHIYGPSGHDPDFSYEVEMEAGASGQDPRNLAFVLRPEEAMYAKKKRLKSPFFSRMDKNQMDKTPDHQGLCIPPHPNQADRFVLFFVAADAKQLRKIVQNSQHMRAADALIYTPPKN